MVSSLHDILQKELSALNAEHIGAAFSGGPDSFTLVHALKEVYASPSQTLHILSVDHGLRPESDREQHSLGRAVRDWPHVKFETLKWTGGQSVESKIQEEARKARYELMAEYCASQGIAHLFLGHHLDDQAETILFRLAKGSGLDGLGGMRKQQGYARDLTLHRPFLDAPKSDLVDYCTQHDLPYVHDPSNENDNFARARLRRSAEILQEEGLTPKRLGVTARRLQNATDALDWAAEILSQEAAGKKETNRFEYNIKTLKGKPFELILRLILSAISDLGDGRDYGPRRQRAEGLCDDAMVSINEDKPFRKRSLGGAIIAVDVKAGRLTIEKEST